MRPLSSCRCGTRLLPLVIAALIPCQRVVAQTISKANNTTVLTSGGSWVGGVVPGATNVAQWDATVTAANTVAIGGNLTVQGLALTNPGGTVTINATSGATLTLGPAGIAMGSATESLVINPAITVSAAETWTGSAGSSTLTVAGAVNLGGATLTISDTAASKVLLKAGLDNGTVAFANTSSGLQVPSMASGTTWTTGFSGSGSGTALDIRATVSLSGTIAMSGGISVNSAAAVVTLAYAGNTFPRLAIPAGTVSFPIIAAQGSACAIGTGATPTSLGFTNNVGKLRYTGPTASTNRSFGRDGRGGGAIEVATADATLTLSANLTSTTPSGTPYSPGWQLGGSGNLVVGGVISDGNATFTTAVSKYGTGTVKLTAANTYTGGTTIGTGTLLVDNVAGSGTGSGVVTVGAAGVLGGNGTTAGAVSFAPGGSLQPGADAGSSPGRLLINGALDLTNASAILEVFGAGGAPGIDYDQIVANGPFNWGGATVAIVPANGFALTTTQGSYTLVSTASVAGNPQAVTVNGTALAFNGGLWSGLIDGSAVTFDATSGVLTVTPPPPVPPTITAQPTSISIPEGGSTGFTVGATYAKTFQWRLNGVPIAGATATSYAIANALSSSAGQYDVIVTNDFGSTTSAPATLTLTAAAPAITSAPVATSGAVGQVLSLSISATGAEQYQWRKDGVAIPGATSPTLVLTNAQPADAGSYDVVLTNPFASTTAQPVVVAVLGKLATVVAGTAQAFDADPDAATYTWKLDGNVLGANTAEYIYQPDTTDAGTHWLTVDQASATGGHTTREWGVKVTIALPDATPVNYYVATDGNDANPGTLGAPFQTLEAARNAIRALSRPLPPGGVTVWLRGGTYYRSASFTLTSSDTGTAAAPIIYRAYPGETPVISGGKPQPAARFSPLRSDQWSRVAPGVDPSSIVELDLSAAGVVNKGPLPASFASWVTYNVYYPSVSGKLCEVIFNGRRMYLSRYPNHDLTNDNVNTPNLAMDGVVQGTLADGSTSYLNYAGTYSYTDTAGPHSVATGGAFQCTPADMAHVARWATAIANGGLWLQGYWRIPWQVNGAKVTAIDTTHGVIMLDPAAAVPNGIGNKYARSNTTPSYGAGNHAEPYWVLNLLEEIDQPGEWAIDFNRNVLYFLPPAPITDNSFVISDLAAPLVQTNAANYMYFRGLTFEAGLAAGVQILNSTRDLVVGCTFRNMNNYPVDINGGTANGVVSNDMINLGGGGVFLQGGDETADPRVPAKDFVVNNRIVNFAVNARVYAGAIDAGFGGESQGTGGGDHLQAVGMRVANNFISTTPHGGVLHGSWDSTFEYNELTQWCQFSDDLGGFYSCDNIGRHGNQTIRYNFLHDSPHGDAIYFDHDHPYMHLYGNVVNLNTLASESRGLGFELRVEATATSLDPQTVDIHDNLIVDAHLAGDMYMALPSVMQNNAYVLTTKPWNWQQITLTSTGSKATASTASVLASGPNPGYGADPGFLDLAGNDLRLNPASALFADMPGFTPAPFELIGVFNDGIRTDASTTRTPYIGNAAVTNVTASSAVASATLTYPQFEANASIAVFWGTTDGGTDPAQWANRQDLGLAAAGPQQATLAELRPGATYYVRFLATNAAGQSWSATPVSFTTLAPPAFTSAATFTGVFGTPMTFQVTATGNPAATLAAANLPPGLQFDPGTGVISGTPSAAGTYAIMLSATNSVGTATAALAATIAKAPATVTLAALSQVYTGGPLAPTVTTAPADLNVTLAYAGNTVPVNAGDYGVTATIDDPNYAGSATDVLVIAKAQPRVTVAGYSITYDTKPHCATGSVSGVAGEALAGLDLAGTVHTNAGAYADRWSFTDITGNYLNAVGTVTDVIAKAPAAVTIAPLAQWYDGTPRAVVATTTPSGLAVNVTYDGEAAAPLVPGEYVVSATVADANYSGTVSDPLNVAITATVNHGINFAGEIDGSVQVLAAEDDALRGTAMISGDLLVPGVPNVKLTGKPTYGGTVDFTDASVTPGYSVSLSGQPVLRHVARRVDPRPVAPVPVPLPPKGARDVTIDNDNADPGDFATINNLTVEGAGTTLAIPPGTYGTLVVTGHATIVLGVDGSTASTVYNLQALQLSGNSEVKLAGPVVLTVANAATVEAAVGSAAHPGWLALQAASGGVALTGSTTFFGAVVAPGGPVTLSGDVTLVGTVTADRLAIEGAAVLVEPDLYKPTAP